MIKDQDFGFEDPNWVPIVKYFLENYHNSLMHYPIMALIGLDCVVTFFVYSEYNEKKETKTFERRDPDQDSNSSQEIDQ